MNIAILGLGTVGSGACEAVKSAIDLEVTRIWFAGRSRNMRTCRQKISTIF